MKKVITAILFLICLCCTINAQSNDEFIYFEEETTPELDKWGLSFSLLGGVSIPNLDMKDYFKALGAFECDFSARCNKFLFGLQAIINGGTLQRDFVKKKGYEYWEKDYRLCLNNLSFYGGYMVYDSKYFRLTPHAFFGMNDVTSGEDEDEYSDQNFKSATMAWGPGCAFDIKVQKLCNLTGESVSVRLNYQYNVSDFKRKYYHASGSLHTITVGFNFTM